MNGPVFGEQTSRIDLYRDYAAALSTTIQKRFLGPLAREKSSKVSVLESESSRGRHDSMTLPEKNKFFPDFWHTTPF
jgi:hypothetical protein